MSWIFGIIRKNDKVILPDRENCPNYNKEKFVAETGEYYFSCGLGHSNSFFKYDKKKDSGWIVCGTGISYEDCSFHLMDFQDWEKFLSKKNNIVNDLNGHFIIVEWSKGNIKMRNDQLGMRDMFFAEGEGYFTFSTRLDWVIPFADNPEIDFDIFGSSWLCVNPLSYECFIKGVKRLSPGGKVNYNDRGFSHKYRVWVPEYANRFVEEDYLKQIIELTSLGLSEKREVLLGLSGGLDSRVLLSILLQQKEKNWSTYSFGDNNFPDAIIAKKLSEKLGFRHFTIPNLYFSDNDEVERFNEFVLQTQTYMIGSLFYEQDHYRELPADVLLIDGGGGGFYRRVLAKMLWLRGRQSIIDKNVKVMKNYIKNNKPIIFSKEAYRIMNEGCNRQLDLFLDEMPDIRQCGTGNWADIFSIRTRSANIGSTTQTRQDSFILNYMPLMQPTMLRYILNKPTYYRVKNKIYQNIIKHNNHGVTRYPLVKDQSITPFTFNTYITHLSEIILRRVKKQKTIDYGTEFLSRNKHFVLTLIRCREVREDPHYDYTKIKSLLEGYYKGQKSYARSVLWWLTFDVWRRFLKESRSKKLV